jgi:CRISPR-associated protein (TIGR02710 family)
VQVIGEGTPCAHAVTGAAAGEKEWRPNLVTQLGLQGFRPDLQIIELPDPDDLNDCLVRLRRFIASLHDRFTHLELCGDFTGGTKSMSSALAIALLDQRATLTVVDGQRENLVRIEHSEGLRIVDPIPFLAHRLLQERLPPLLESHFYGRARSLLVDFRRDQADRLSADQLQAVDGLSEQLQVLVLWDRFCWGEALEQAQQHGFAGHWPDLFAWWQRVEASIEWDGSQDAGVAITGYELVQDLLLNAERRGRRGWFDDAVARLYRASELLAQTYIRLETRLMDSPNITGVSSLYRWLQEQEAPAGLGGIYSRQWWELKRLFDTRNRSLLGHGLQPIDRATWESLQARVTNLLTLMLAELGIEQGPSPCQLPGVQLLQQPHLSVLLDSSTTQQL